MVETRFTVEKWLYMEDCLVSIILATISNVAVTPGRRSHGVLNESRKPTCEPWKRNQRRGNTVASPVNTVRSHRTPGDGANFVYAQNKHCPEKRRELCTKQTK